MIAMTGYEQKTSEMTGSHLTKSMRTGLKTMRLLPLFCHVRTDRRRTSGFTLIELLIIMTIISILMSLLFAGVQSVREAANRVICMNNLAQWGKAIDAHVAVQTWYPTGGWGSNWVGDADRGFGTRQPGGWVYNLLPYIGQQGLHDLGGLNNTVIKISKPAAANELVQSVLSSANCPTRRRSILFKNYLTYMKAPHTVNNAKLGGLPPPAAVARTDYAFVSGNGSSMENGGGPTTFTQGDKRAYYFKLYGYSSGHSYFFVMEGGGYGSAPNGLCFSMSEITPAHITTGLSCMITIGEKYVNPDKYFTGADAGDNVNMYTGMNDDQWRTTYFPPLRDNNDLLSFAPIFGSAHANGCNFLFADGSVRVISYNVDSKSFRPLGARDHAAYVNMTNLER
jgi:prepilin-type processing-associated H-X9-DG protein/prepilin-type N-terminal cleavage/methylation domain-containing protein